MSLATTDPLTGANNRRTGGKRLDEQFRRWQYYKRGFAVLLVDCDHFKRVNDTYGHEAGDAVLRMLVRLFRENTRDKDAVIRWGGEEFLVLLADMDAEDARLAAERLRAAVEAASVESGGHTITVTASVGLARPVEGEAHPHDIVRRADAAVYEAKHQGRNRVVEG